MVKTHESHDMNLRYKNQILLKFLALILLACGGQDKEDASNFFLKGNQAFVQNNYTEALRLQDDAPEIRFKRGSILLLYADEPQLAYTDLRIAAADPGLAADFKELAELLAKKGKATEAWQVRQLIERP